MLLPLGANRTDEFERIGKLFLRGLKQQFFQIFKKQKKFKIYFKSSCNKISPQKPGTAGDDKSQADDTSNHYNFKIFSEKNKKRFLSMKLGF